MSQKILPKSRRGQSWIQWHGDAFEVARRHRKGDPATLFDSKWLRRKTGPS